MEKQTFNTDNKKITVYPALAENRPVIYLTTYNDDGGKIYAEVQKGGCPDFTLVTVSGLNWEAELSPWAAGNLFKYSEMFTGGADIYLQFLTQQVLPQAETGLNGILWRGLAGYSLAGLFTVYALYKTDLFSRAASMSGSLWYPGFKDFALQARFVKLRSICIFRLAIKKHAHATSTLKPCSSVRKNWQRITAALALTLIMNLTSAAITVILSAAAPPALSGY